MCTRTVLLLGKEMEGIPQALLDQLDAPVYIYIHIFIWIIFLRADSPRRQLVGKEMEGIPQELLDQLDAAVEIDTSININLVIIIVLCAGSPRRQPCS